MHQDIHAAEYLPGFFCHSVNLFIRCHVAFFHKAAPDLLRQRSYPPFQIFAGVTDAQPGALLVKSLGDAPGNGTFVSQAKNDGGFSLQQTHCCLRYVNDVSIQDIHSRTVICFFDLPAASETSTASSSMALAHCLTPPGG